MRPGHALSRPIICVVLAGLLTPAAVAYWGQRTLNDTQRYVDTVEPLVASPEVQDVAAWRGRCGMAERAIAQPRRGERRLPMALAVVAAAGLYLLIPADFRIGKATHIGYPMLLLLLLGLLVVGDPGRIDRERQWLRVTTGALIAIITGATAISAVRLVLGILQNADFTTPGQLLSVGAAVWSTNVIAFALWYWHLDCGGPAARGNRTSSGAPAFRFPEQDISSLSEAGWYPQFVDYLALSFNTATAFSPADVSAIRHWSKLWLIAESAISLTLAALVIARAVNVM